MIVALHPVLYALAMKSLFRLTSLLPADRNPHHQMLQTFFDDVQAPGNIAWKGCCSLLKKYLIHSCPHPVILKYTGEKRVWNILLYMVLLFLDYLRTLYYN